MSLYESGDSSGKASLQAMYDGTQKSCNTGEVSLEHLAYLIVRGGWPQNIGVSVDKAQILPKTYIDSVLDSDIEELDGQKINKNRMNLILKSLSRNETSLAANSKILTDVDDIKGSSSEDVSSLNTLKKYLDILDRLYLIENQEAYDINFMSSSRVGKQVKRHLTDPSLACVCLNLDVDKLMYDMTVFGLLFESLVERDLRIYADYLDAKLFHFRDNVSGTKVDLIIEFPNGEYCAIEIKTGFKQTDKAIEDLMKFYNYVERKPKFMCIIVGIYNGSVKDPKTGIYIVPITALKP